MLQQLIQWYIGRFPFPHRGLKYFIQLAKRQQWMDIDFVKPLGNGVQLHCKLAEHIERQILWYGGYELRETKWLIQELATAKCFYDIGANIGYYALQAAKYFASGQKRTVVPVARFATLPSNTDNGATGSPCSNAI